jgi:hypothetical protein
MTDDVELRCSNRRRGARSWPKYRLTIKIKTRQATHVLSLRYRLNTEVCQGLTLGILGQLACSDQAVVRPLGHLSL